MKKKIMAIIAMIVVLIVSFLIGTGFTKNPNVVLIDYVVSEDGTEITLNIGIPYPIGYTRGFKNSGGGVKPHMLTFYNTFGGINSSWGATRTFTLEIAPDDTEIYFNRQYKGYELVLVKDETTGKWAKPNDIIEEKTNTFEATILEIHDSYYLVEPLEGSQELRSSDKIEVPMKNLDTSLKTNIGDIIEITYSGEILETYPAHLSEVYDIRVTKEAEEWNLIPMVMVNGKLYLDTGYESAVEARCGMMDGEIDSTVDAGQKPTKDNQSNFGAGYGYQYGATEGTIEIYMNEKWWIFATEEVRKEMQFPTEATNDFADFETFVVRNIINEFLIEHSFL